MNPASMSAARTGLLGELFPDILNAGTDFMNGSDINMEELMKLEPDVVIYSAGSKELGEALRAAGFAAVGISVNKWDYDSIETYDQWITLLSEIFPEKEDTAERVSQYSHKVYEDLYENAIGQDDWSPVKAVRDKNVFKLPLGTYRSYTPSTDTPLTLLWMAKQVYPDLFADVDINKEVKDYYKDMYGVELTDGQVQRMYHPGRDAAAGFKK